MNPKCDLCPCSDGLTCIDQVTGHGHFCTRLRMRPDLAPAVVRLSEEAASRPESGNEPPLPSPVAVAINFTAATARDAAHGFARLPAEAIEARLAICRGCDRYRPSDGRCSACGCHLAGVNAKAARPHERCPLERWPEYPGRPRE